MRIFVAGATGVVGRRAVDRLIEAGHDVTGVARSPAKAAQLHRQGATPVTVDLFDAAAVKEAVAGHDVVINLATHIPPMSQAALPRAWAENDRIRTEVSRNLVDAALAAGSDRYIQESISFLYEDAGDGWVTEASPLQVPAYARSTQVAEVEAARFAAAGGAGVVLRFALFYGPDSHGTLDLLRLAAHRLPPAPGAAASFISSLATDDAATAVVAALAVPSGTYNVADDEPVTRGEFGRTVATALGVRPPRQGLSVMARAAGSKTELLMRSQRVANGTFREASGWVPAFPSVREGYRLRSPRCAPRILLSPGRRARRALCASAWRSLLPARRCSGCGRWPPRGTSTTRSPAAAGGWRPTGPTTSTCCATSVASTSVSPSSSWSRR